MLFLRSAVSAINELPFVSVYKYAACSLPLPPGAVLDALDGEGCTPLHLAVRKDNPVDVEVRRGGMHDTMYLSPCSHAHVGTHPAPWSYPECSTCDHADGAHALCTLHGQH